MMPRKEETRAFIINCLRAIAKNKKILASLRLRAIDRIAVMEEFYPITLVDYYGTQSGRQMPEPKTDVDERVEKMLKQLGGEDASKLS